MRVVSLTSNIHILKEYMCILFTFVVLVVIIHVLMIQGKLKTGISEKNYDVTFKHHAQIIISGAAHLKSVAFYSGKCNRCSFDTFIVLP